jgi:hypothetical protein
MSIGSQYCGYAIIFSDSEPRIRNIEFRILIPEPDQLRT